MCNNLFPLLKENAKVVNVSSILGRVRYICGDEPNATRIQNELSSENLTIEKVCRLMNEFVELTKYNSDVHIRGGWCDNSYIVSKIGVNALTKCQQDIFDKEIPFRNIVNYIYL